MEAAKVPFNIRAGDLKDIPFIFNSWLKSFRDSAAVKSVPNTIYYAEHHAVIERIFAAAGLVLLVACDPGDAEQIFGYVVGERRSEGLMIHWTYVKHSFRKFGVARALVEALLAVNIESLPVFYSHAPKGADALLKSKPYIYNPYAIGKR